MRHLEDVAMVMNSNLDQVAVAKEDISPGTILKYKGDKIEIKNLIKNGHRFALHDILEGKFIRQYGYPFAQSKGILKGELISVSNIKNVLPEIDSKKYKEPAETELKEKYVKKIFWGYKRKDGKTGTRNYYLVIPTSMCASETAFQVASGLDNDSKLLKRYSNIDGIVAIPHTEGCGCDSGLQIDRLMTVLKGYACHPNVGGCLMMDMGCEQTNYEKMYEYLKDTVGQDLKPIDWITIQESGGTRPTIEKARSIIQDRLSKVNQIRREPVPISNIVIGTECGASDSFSGITANPLIGNVADKIVFGGGSAILSEVTEMLGTFDMLLPRFRSLDTALRFKGLIDWYTELAGRLCLTLEPNLVPKNIEGGLINNYIKSLGAVMKGGTTAIEDVLEYGEPLKKKGLSIMQGPGNDPESVTGIVAAGATVICFSTGKGTTTGDAICPVIKISSNEDTFKKLPEDMDFDGSRLLRDNTSIDALGEELLDKVIAVASGEKTWSEKWKQRQFQVWTAGKLSL
ncbi:MAG: UxaA family hydrolase [Nitrospirae bacterium]|nr:UxaA family hydrolase [Nitrospirota bacterium]